MGGELSALHLLVGRVVVVGAVGSGIPHPRTSRRYRYLVLTNLDGDGGSVGCWIRFVTAGAMIPATWRTWAVVAGAHLLRLVSS